MDSHDDDGETLPDNVSPIRDKMMFVFDPVPNADPLDPEGAAGAPYHIEIGSMIEGELVVTRKIIGIETKDEGFESLRKIGMVWETKSGCIGRLRDKDGKELAQLEIHHGYAVLPVVEPEEGG